MRKKVFNKVLYSLELHKGSNAEKIFLRIITAHYQEFPWIDHVRMATQKEDRKGIDLIVETKDIGKLFIQIKSSVAGVKKFRKKYPRRLSAVIIVKEQYLDADIWRAARLKLLKLREKILLKRKP
jgi:hypothetical protein